MIILSILAISPNSISPNKDRHPRRTFSKTWTISKCTISKRTFSKNYQQKVHYQQNTISKKYLQKWQDKNGKKRKPHSQKSRLVSQNANHHTMAPVLSLPARVTVVTTPEFINIGLNIVGFDNARQSRCGERTNQIVSASSLILASLDPRHSLPSLRTFKPQILKQLVLTNRVFIIFSWLSTGLRLEQRRLRWQELSEFMKRRLATTSRSISVPFKLSRP